MAKRRTFTAAFNARVAREALGGNRTVQPSSRRGSRTDQRDLGRCSAREVSTRLCEEDGRTCL